MAEHSAGVNPKVVRDYELDAPIELLSPVQLADNVVVLVQAIADGSRELEELTYDRDAFQERLGFFNEDKDRLQAILEMVFAKALNSP